MFNIGIYANSTERKEIKKTISQCLDEINVVAQISYIRNKSEILNIFNFDHKYNIIIVVEKSNLMYIKKSYTNYGKKVVNITSGFLEKPINNQTLEEILFSSNEYLCPHSIFEINNKKTFRLIPHEDIEYFHWSDGKTVVYLTNNETEEIPQTTKKIKEFLSEDYFAECTKGYLVNLFNLKKINKVNHEIILKSGAIIPISRKNFNNILLMIIKSVFGYLN